MSKQTIYRVTAVEGRLIIHPSSVGTGMASAIGHESYLDQDDLRYPLGQPVPALKWRLRKDSAERTQAVLETPDEFFRSKIADGDLDYVCTLSSFEDGAEETIDPALARATAKNVAARAPAPAAAPERTKRALPDTH